MPLSRTKSLALDQRRADVAARYLTGETEASIARSYQVHRSQISRDIKALRREWQERRGADFECAQAEHIARLEALLAEAWAAYRLSKEERRTATRTEDANKQTTITVRTETHAPSASLLGEVRQTLAELARIWGFNAPLKQDVTLHDFSHLTDDELRALWLEEAAKVIGEADSITRRAAETRPG